MRGGKKVVGTVAVFQAEDAVAVLGPATALLVGLTGQQCRKMHLLRAESLELLPDDGLDLAPHLQPQRQPREHSRGLTADVASAHQKTVAGYLGVDRVLAEGADKELGEAC